MALSADNVTGIGTLIQYINGATNDMAGIGFLFALVFIVFIGLLNWGSDRAFATSMYAGLLASIFLRFGGLITDRFVFLFVLLTAIGTVWLFKNSLFE